MPDDVTRTHASYAEATDRWRRCRDVFDGGDAVRRAGTRYLPKLGSSQTEEDYQAYKLRAVFYEGFGRSVSGLKGIAFATPPAVTAPDALKEFLHDITLANEPFEGVATKAVEDVLIVGRRGLLVEFSDSAQRPYLVGYKAEAITDWDTIKVKGDTILSWLVLKECVSTRDRFTVKETEQYRVCELTWPVTDGAPVYTVTTYTKEKNEDGEKYVAGPPVTPLRRGVPLPFIPFVFLGPVGVTTQIERPPLLGVADVNLSHYRSSADLEHGRHFTALPTPVVSGARVGDTLRIGSGSVWILEEANARASFLEFTGQGLKSLEQALADKERLMTILGSRLLEAQKVAQEAAATVRMRHAGDNATLQSIVGGCNLALTLALRWMAFWAGLTDRQDDPEVKVELNTEFVGADVDLNGLSLLAQADKISYETLYYNLERAGLTRPNITAEIERQQILSEGGLDPRLPQPLPRSPLNPPAA